MRARRPRGAIGLHAMRARGPATETAASIVDDLLVCSSFCWYNSDPEECSSNLQSFTLQEQWLV